MPRVLFLAEGVLAKCAGACHLTNLMSPLTSGSVDIWWKRSTVHVSSAAERAGGIWVNPGSFSKTQETHYSMQDVSGLFSFDLVFNLLSPKVLDPLKASKASLSQPLSTPSQVVVLVQESQITLKSETQTVVRVRLSSPSLHRCH